MVEVGPIASLALSSARPPKVIEPPCKPNRATLEALLSARSEEDEGILIATASPYVGPPPLHATTTKLTLDAMLSGEPPKRLKPPSRPPPPPPRPREPPPRAPPVEDKPVVSLDQAPGPPPPYVKDATKRFSEIEARRRAESDEVRDDHRRRLRGLYRSRADAFSAQLRVVQRATQVVAKERRLAKLERAHAVDSQMRLDEHLRQPPPPDDELKTLFLGDTHRKAKLLLEELDEAVAAALPSPKGKNMKILSRVRAALHPDDASKLPKKRAHSVSREVLLPRDSSFRRVARGHLDELRSDGAWTAAACELLTATARHPTSPVALFRYHRPEGRRVNSGAIALFEASDVSIDGARIDVRPSAGARPPKRFRARSDHARWRRAFAEALQSDVVEPSSPSGTAPVDRATLDELTPVAASSMANAPPGTWTWTTIETKKTVPPLLEESDLHSTPDAIQEPSTTRSTRKPLFQGTPLPDQTRQSVHVDLDDDDDAVVGLDDRSIFAHDGKRGCDGTESPCFVAETRVPDEKVAMTDLSSAAAKVRTANIIVVEPSADGVRVESRCADEVHTGELLPSVVKEAYRAADSIESKKSSNGSPGVWSGDDANEKPSIGDWIRSSLAGASTSRERSGSVFGRLMFGAEDSTLAASSISPIVDNEMVGVVEPTAGEANDARLKKKVDSAPVTPSISKNDAVLGASGDRQVRLASVLTPFSAAATCAERESEVLRAQKGPIATHTPQSDGVTPIPLKHNESSGNWECRACGNWNLSACSTCTKCSRPLMRDEQRAAPTTFMDVNARSTLSSTRMEQKAHTSMQKPPPAPSLQKTAMQQAPDNIASAPKSASLFSRTVLRMNAEGESRDGGSSSAAENVVVLTRTASFHDSPTSSGARSLDAKPLLQTESTTMPSELLSLDEGLLKVAVEPCVSCDKDEDSPRCESLASAVNHPATVPAAPVLDTKLTDEPRRARRGVVFDTRMRPSSELLSLDEGLLKVAVEPCISCDNDEDSPQCESLASADNPATVPAAPVLDTKVTDMPRRARRGVVFDTRMRPSSELLSLDEGLLKVAVEPCISCDNDEDSPRCESLASADNPATVPAAPVLDTKLTDEPRRARRGVVFDTRMRPSSELLSLDEGLLKVAVEPCISCDNDEDSPRCESLASADNPAIVPAAPILDTKVTDMPRRARRGVVFDIRIGPSVSVLDTRATDEPVFMAKKEKPTVPVVTTMGHRDDPHAAMERDESLSKQAASPPWVEPQLPAAMCPTGNEWMPASATNRDKSAIRDAGMMLSLGHPSHVVLTAEREMPPPAPAKRVELIPAASRRALELAEPITNLEACGDTPISLTRNEECVLNHSSTELIAPAVRTGLCEELPVDDDAARYPTSKPIAASEPVNRTEFNVATSRADDSCISNHSTELVAPDARTRLRAELSVAVAARYPPVSIALAPSEPVIRTEFDLTTSFTHDKCVSNDSTELVGPPAAGTGLCEKTPVADTVRYPSSMPVAPSRPKEPVIQMEFREEPPTAAANKEDFVPERHCSGEISPLPRVAAPSDSGLFRKACAKKLASPETTLPPHRVEEDDSDHRNRPAAIVAEEKVLGSQPSFPSDVRAKSDDDEYKTTTNTASSNGYLEVLASTAAPHAASTMGAPATQETTIREAQRHLLTTQEVENATTTSASVACSTQPIPSPSRISPQSREPTIAESTDGAMRSNIFVSEVSQLVVVEDSGEVVVPKRANVVEPTNECAPRYNHNVGQIVDSSSGGQTRTSVDSIVDQTVSKDLNEARRSGFKKAQTRPNSGAIVEPTRESESSNEVLPRRPNVEGECSKATTDEDGGCATGGGQEATHVPFSSCQAARSSLSRECPRPDDIPAACALEETMEAASEPRIGVPGDDGPSRARQAANNGGSRSHQAAHPTDTVFDGDIPDFTDLSHLGDEWYRSYHEHHGIEVVSSPRAAYALVADSVDAAANLEEPAYSKAGNDATVDIPATLEEPAYARVGADLPATLESPSAQRRSMFGSFLGGLFARVGEDSKSIPVDGASSSSPGFPTNASSPGFEEGTVGRPRLSIARFFGDAQEPGRMTPQLESMRQGVPSFISSGGFGGPGFDDDDDDDDSLHEHQARTSGQDGGRFGGGPPFDDDDDDDDSLHEHQARTSGQDGGRFGGGPPFDDDDDDDDSLHEHHVVAGGDGDRRDGGEEATAAVLCASEWCCETTHSSGGAFSVTHKEEWYCAACWIGFAEEYPGRWQDDYGIETMPPSDLSRPDDAPDGEEIRVRE